ncbi:MAG: prolipoprotein diacylglyceryl transferase [Thermoanaerobaculia bacterium]
MRPFLLEFGGVGVGSYPFLLVAGICVLLLTSVAIAERRGLPGHHVAILVPLAYVAGLVGGRLAWVLQNRSSFADPLGALVAPQPGGLTIYGGLIGGGLVAAVYAFAFRLPAARIADAAVLGLGLAAAFGRIGCFLAGCCYGRPADLPWSVVFPAGSMPAVRWGDGVPIHPSQLYEAAAFVALAGICHRIGRRSAPAGQGFLCLVLGYSVFRFVHEFVRADSTPVFLDLTLPQWISVALAVLAGSLLANRGRQHRNGWSPTWILD